MRSNDLARAECICKVGNVPLVAVSPLQLASHFPRPASSQPPRLACWLRLALQLLPVLSSRSLRLLSVLQLAASELPLAPSFAPPLPSLRLRRLLDLARLLVELDGAGM